MAKKYGSDEATVCPSVGAVIVTSGSVLAGGGGLTASVMWLDPVSPWPSVTAAVIVWAHFLFFGMYVPGGPHSERSPESAACC